MAHKLGLLFVLYFCQGLPGGFLAVVLPVLLREQGASLTTIGLASFLSLPWTLKILWAPLVDRFGSARFGRRKSWIVPAHLGMILVTLSLALFPPAEHLRLVALLFLLLNVFAATQDVGVDGLAVDVLRDDEMGPGNSAQIAGFKLGNLFGGGVLLTLYTWLGWRGDLIVIAACVAGAMALLLATDETALAGRARAVAPAAERGGVLGDLWQALRRQGLLLFGFLFLAKFGETFAGSLVKPMLFDRGLSKEMIGALDGIAGSIATIGGALAGGVACRRFGWRRTLALASALQGALLVALGWYSTGEVTLVGAGALNALENFAGGGVGVAVFALAMGLCCERAGASQFTASQVCYMSGSFAAYPLAGRAADWTHALATAAERPELGYLPVMATGGVLALGLCALTLAAGARFDRARPPRARTEPSEPARA